MTGYSNSHKVCWLQTKWEKNMKIDHKLIGKRIKTFRQHKGYTQAVLAEKVGATSGYVSLLETGKKKATLEMLLQICACLEITLDVLLVGNQVMQKSDYNQEISDFLESCNEYERKILYEIIKATKDVMINNRDYIRKHIEN